ncbi:hypothetical protein [Pontibacter populi]|uniref:Lipoprotein n=1 Tax=Pontibacter populi TaxID=890055 RepID=A0ABV1RP47_9BACT
MKTIISRILTPIGTIFLLGFGCDTLATMPKHAFVFVNDNDEYIAPPFLMHDGFDDTRLINFYADAYKLKLKRYRDVIKDSEPHNECREGEYYVQEGRSVSGSLLEYLGVLPTLKPRWNEDGSWNY